MTRLALASLLLLTGSALAAGPKHVAPKLKYQVCNWSGENCHVVPHEEFIHMVIENFKLDHADHQYEYQQAIPGNAGCWQHASNLGNGICQMTTVYSGPGVHCEYKEKESSFFGISYTIACTFPEMKMQATEDDLLALIGVPKEDSAFRWHGPSNSMMYVQEAPKP
jgi:hypothetical protein